MKQFSDAAQLYQKAELYEKAASLLISIKDFTRVAPLMEHIQQPRLLLAYAKAKEAEQDFNKAIKAYERARDMDSVVCIP